MATILLQVEKQFAPALRAIAAETSGSVSVLQTDRFEGQAELINAVIVLGSISIPALAKIVIESIRARRHVVIKKKGITITGLSEENALKTLTKLANDD